MDEIKVWGMTPTFFYRLMLILGVSIGIICELGIIFRWGS